jgi:glucose-1-phosphate adenylyltransferase
MVLAGGRGSRLGQLTDNRAKPAVPFGGKFRIIDFALSNCVNSRIRRIGVATQYKAQSLIQHLKCGWSFLDDRFGEFVDVLPAQRRLEDHWYLGTADAVYPNLDLLQQSEPELVLVLAGDHLRPADRGPSQQERRHDGGLPRNVDRRGAGVRRDWKRRRLAHRPVH